MNFTDSLFKERKPNIKAINETVKRTEILIVDDAVVNLQLLAEILSSNGYKVRPVTSGAAALQAAKISPPDLILLDINMPEMDGYEVCRHMKADAVLKDIAILFISAIGEDGDKIKAFECGGVDYITKPFLSGDLLARIRTHIQIRQLRLALIGRNIQLEEKVQAQNRKNIRDELIAQHARDPLLLVALDGRICEVNHAAEQLYGYTREEFLQLRVHDLRPTDDPETINRQLQQSDAHGLLFEAIHFCKNGVTMPVEVNTRGTVLEGQKMVLSVIRDLTERRRTEKMLSDFHENLDLLTIEQTKKLKDDNTAHLLLEEVLREDIQRAGCIIKGANAGTWEWNIQTGAIVCNERWAEIIGYTLAEISPTSIKTWMTFAHPDDLSASNEILEKHFKGELDYYECAVRMKHKDGSWIVILDRGKVMTWMEDRKPLLMFGTHQNITESKRAELEQQKLIHNLQEAMAHIKTLQGLLPICSGCKKIREDHGYWEEIESFISKHSETQFTHTLCPNCVKKYFPELVGVDI